MALDVNLNIKMIGASGTRLSALSKMQGGGSGGNSSPMARMTRQSQQAQNDLTKRIKSLVYSTRIGSGGNVMPLVGKIAGVIGTEATAAVAGIGLLAAAAKNAADTLTDFRREQITGGGTALETARLGAIGGTGEDARAFTDLISQGGIATGIAGQMGITHTGGFDSLDSSKKLLAAVHKLEEISDNGNRALAIREARFLKLEKFLGRLDLSKGTRNQLDADAKLGAGIMTTDRVKAAAEFNAQLGRVGDAFGRLSTVLGTDLMKSLTSIFELVANTLNAFTKFWESDTGKLLKPFVFPVVELLGKGAKAANDYYDKHTDATEKNTKALQSVSSQLQQGIHGGSQAAGAIPSALFGNVANQMHLKSVNLGAFSFAG